MATVSLGRQYASSIFLPFPLCMESNVLEKSTNRFVASRFLARTPSSEYVTLCSDFFESHYDFFRGNVLHFSLDTTKKQGIINLSRCRCETHASVIIRNFEVAFNWEGKEKLSAISLLCFLYRLCCIIVEVCRQISKVHEVFPRGLQLFSFVFCLFFFFCFFLQYSIKLFLRKLS